MNKPFLSLLVKGKIIIRISDTMKKKYFKIPSVIFLLLISVSVSKAQDTIVVRDFETWTGLSIEKKLINDKLKLNLTQEFRADNNSSHLNEFFTEGLASYNFLHNFEIGLGYRFLRVNTDEKGYESKHRFNTDFNYKFNINRFDFSSRLRYQRSNETWFDNSESDFSTNKFRLNLTGIYNIRNWKFDPYFSSELFYLNKSDEFSFIDEYISTYKISGFEKLRITVGTKYKLKKLGRIKMFFRYEQEFKKYSNSYNLSEKYFILGLNFKLKL